MDKRNHWCRMQHILPLILLSTAFTLGTPPTTADAAPSAAPCDPDDGVGVDLRDASYVVDYHMTSALFNAPWDDAASWSFGSWAEEVAGAALVPAARPFSCLSGAGDTVLIPTSYPRVIIDSGKNVLIDGAIDPIGELIIEAGATLWVGTDLTTFLSTFGTADIGGTIQVDGTLIIAAGYSAPLPGASVGSNGEIAVGNLGTITMDAGAIFSGSGEIHLLGASIEVTDDLTINGVDLILEENRSEIRGLPGATYNYLSLDAYAQVKPTAWLDLGIGMDEVFIKSNFIVEGSLFLRAAATTIEADFGLLFIDDGGTATTQQDGSTLEVNLTNHNNLWVKSGGTLAVTPTLGAYDPANVTFVNAVDGLLAVEIDALITTEKAPSEPVPYLHNFGRLDLAGEIHGNLRNSGTIYPGSSPGTATINGDLTLFETSVIQIDLDGAEQGVSYDTVLVSGAASLDGTLRIYTDESFTPSASDTFIFIEANALTETFETIEGAGSLPVSYAAKKFILGATPFDPSDIDMTGWVRPDYGTLPREETSFCVDNDGFLFDIIFGIASNHDLAFIALSTDTDTGFSGSTPSEVVRHNWFTVADEPDSRILEPLVRTSDEYPGRDRLEDGVITNYTFTNLGSGFWRFLGKVPHGSEPFVAEDLVGSLGLRSSQAEGVTDDRTRTNVYTGTSFPELLTVVGAEKCSPVPEPSAGLLSAVALGTLGLLRRRTAASPR